jgi:hypothetical protein
MTTPPRSSTSTIIHALQILARDIQSQDGVATAALLEAADRLKELHEALDDSCGLNENWAATCEPGDLEYFSEYRKVIKQARHALGEAEK